VYLGKSYCVNERLSTMTNDLRFLCILMLVMCSSYAQITQPKKDSITVFDKIDAYSKKNKVTKWAHKLIFKEPSSQAPPVRKRRTQSRFLKTEGKIIRTIHIETLDPFGYSERDTAAKPKKALSKLGNSLHLKTRNFTIRNLLLFKKNKLLDSLLIRESARLIRSQRYVRRVNIQAQLVSPKSDSVDVYVRVLDSWSLIPEVSGSTSKTELELTERNVGGLGHQWENTFRQNLKDERKAFSTEYTVPNIFNSYISTTLSYQNNVNNDSSRSLSIDRSFFSPYTRWAGGILVERRFRSDSLPDISNDYNLQRFKYTTYDFWGGHSFRLFTGNSEGERSTNLITSLRFLNTQYLISPSDVYDPLKYYHDEQFYMGTIGLTSRSFVEDTYIFNYGITEDVPVGKVFGLTLGYQKKNDLGRLYVGGRGSIGNYLSWGYLSTNVEWGTFFRDHRAEQTALVLEANYFTNLIELNRWKVRQFVKPKIVIGNNRMETRFDKLTLNENAGGIQGFSTRELLGTKKVMLTFQTQTYSPWEWLGFRFSPYCNYTVAMLSDATNSFKKSKAFNAFALGVILSNDYLVFSSFQLSFAYYPSIPEQGYDVLKTNAFNTEDFGLQQFELNKPLVVPYR
jgi:hypothetical protein